MPPGGSAGPSRKEGRQKSAPSPQVDRNKLLHFGTQERSRASVLLRFQRNKKRGMTFLWRTHFVAGAGLGAAYGAVFHQGDPGIMAASAGIGGIAALLPDVDSPHSNLGRAARPVSDVLNFALGHRGFLYFLLGATVVLALAAFAALFWAPSGAVWSLLVSALAAGYLSHLLLDALTPGGVPLLWPRGGSTSLPLVRTGSFFERVVFLPALAVAVALVVWGVAK